MKKKLYRIREGKILTGVCGGIARYFDVSPKVIRLLWGNIFCGIRKRACCLYSVFNVRTKRAKQKITVIRHQFLFVKLSTRTASGSKKERRVNATALITYGYTYIIK